MESREHGVAGHDAPFGFGSQTAPDGHEVVGVRFPIVIRRVRLLFPVKNRFRRSEGLGGDPFAFCRGEGKGSAVRLFRQVNR